MSSEEQKPRDARDSGAAPEPKESEPHSTDKASGSGNGAGEDLTSDPEPSLQPAADTEPRKPPTYYDDYDYQDDDPYADAPKAPAAATEGKTESKAPPPPPPPPGGDGTDGGDEDDEGMARMSFLDHLDELRTRILHSIYGLGTVYLACLIFAQTLWEIVAQPFLGAVENYDPPLSLTQLAVSEAFYLKYLKVPLVFGVFVAAPWLMYQAWAFIAPGLYKRERRWALPFILSTATLFVLGGVFGYFIALRYAIAFMVSVGEEMGIQQLISADSYFNTGIAIILGLGVVFQMPVVIFFLTLIRLVTPTFLLNNVRYAILIIFVLAAAITPTPDVFNMILFAAPMILLFYVGIFASYLLVLSREGRKMPASVIATLILVLLAIGAGVVYYLHVVMGFQFSGQFPWLVPPQ